MRQKNGDVVRASDGDCTEFEVMLTELTSRGAVGKILKKQVVSEDPPFIWLGQAIPKGWKLDFIVEKAVELGAWAVSPILAERSIPRLDTNRTEDRLSRWQRVAEAARKQCGRIHPMRIESPVSIQTFLEETKNTELKIIFHPKARIGLRETLSTISSTASVALLIGPEGGFTESEVHSAEEAGFCSTRMGPQTLRSETAPIAILAILEYLFGKLGEAPQLIEETDNPPGEWKSHED
jgi:16S rRNA (uracil1498-N3)-methyltransferase